MKIFEREKHWLARCPRRMADVRTSIVLPLSLTRQGQRAILTTMASRAFFATLEGSAAQSLVNRACLSLIPLLGCPFGSLPGKRNCCRSVFTLSLLVADATIPVLKCSSSASLTMR